MGNVGDQNGYVKVAVLADPQVILHWLYLHLLMPVSVHVPLRLILILCVASWWIERLTACRLNPSLWRWRSSIRICLCTEPTWVPSCLSNRMWFCFWVIILMEAHICLMKSNACSFLYFFWKSCVRKSPFTMECLNLCTTPARWLFGLSPCCI